MGATSDQVKATRAEPEDVLVFIGPRADIIVPLANGEPRRLITAIDTAGPTLEGVRVHQMHAAYDYPYLHGCYRDRLTHVSYFLSAATRSAYADGGCQLVPAHFSDMPRLLRRTTACSLVVAQAAPPDRHGFFSLGTNADYVARFLGNVPIFLEVNPNMPRTFGENNVHVSQIVGWCESDYPLLIVPPPQVENIDRRIAGFIAERVPDGATLQAGIGAVPNALLEVLTEHKDLGIHTELLTDGVVDLVESGAATGLRKTTRPGKVVATFAMGTARTYDFVADNPVVEMLPVVSNASCRSTPPSRSTSSGSATPRSSTAATGPAVAGRPTSPGGRCTPPRVRASSFSIRRPMTARCRASCLSCRLGPRSPPTRTRWTWW
jgi:acyl-CoA hydrolase